MADFVSSFWNWFIIVPTVVGILALFPLLLWNRGKKMSGDETETTGHVWDDDLTEYNHPLPAWWLNLFIITLIFGIVYLILYPGLGSFQGLLNWSSIKQYETEVAAANERYGPLYEQFAAVDIRTLAQDEAAQRTGERLFANYCTVCHGSDARGAKGYPNLRDQNWQWGGSPEQIKTSILDGRTGGMPGWEEVLGIEGVLDVTEYVISLSDREHDATAAARGKGLYETTCAACHQADGTGNQDLGAPNLTDRIWLYGGAKKSILESIRNGRNGIMPAHAEFLGNDRVHLLAAYIYGLSQEYENE